MALFQNILKKMNLCQPRVSIFVYFKAHKRPVEVNAVKLKQFKFFEDVRQY